MNFRVTGLILAAAVIGAGSLTSVAGAQEQAPAPRAQKASRDIITRAQLDAKAAPNLHELVSALRSHWLRGSANARANMSITGGGSSGSTEKVLFADPENSPTTGVGAQGGPSTLVYVDGRRFGTLTALRSMPTETVEKLCYFPVNRAQNRFGLAVESPVIEVFMRGSSYAETAC